MSGRFEWTRAERAGTHFVLFLLNFKLLHRLQPRFPTVALVGQGQTGRPAPRIEVLDSPEAPF